MLGEGILLDILADAHIRKSTHFTILDTVNPCYKESKLRTKINLLFFFFFYLRNEYVVASSFTV